MNYLKAIGRSLVVLLAIALLLLPGWLMASVWTPINLEVALLAIVISVVAAIFFPKWKWISAVVSSLLIAVPPYPYWLFNDNEGRWYLHFFHGFNLQDFPFLSFGAVFMIALALFWAIYWAIGKKYRDNDAG